IAVFTRGGHTARVMSKIRPDVPVLAFTPDKRTYQRLGLCWGITPFLVPFASTVESMIKTVEEALIESTLMKAGQQVILISGFPVGEMLPPNFVLLHTLGSKQ
ncbi:MAG TPA: pyruvate kinase alpha/beta domain-containing protein, partial [Leptolinea sp.]